MAAVPEVLTAPLHLATHISVCSTQIPAVTRPGTRKGKNTGTSMHYIASVSFMT